MKTLLVIAAFLLLAYCVLGSSHSGGARSVSVPAASGAGSYREMARQAAINEGIPPDLFVRQVNQESGFDPGARGADGEIGMCQFMPSTAAGLGVNPYDPADCLRGMALVDGRYDRQYGGFEYALAGYNCGGGCLHSAVVTYGAAWYLHIGSARAYICAIMGEYC